MQVRISSTIETGTILTSLQWLDQQRDDYVISLGYTMNFESLRDLEGTNDKLFRQGALGCTGGDPICIKQFVVAKFSTPSYDGGNEGGMQGFNGARSRIR